jgi:transposase
LGFSSIGKGAAMPKPYSTDLRERVLLACEAGAAPTQVAIRFRVGPSTVYLWRKQAREEGRREAKPHAGGPAPKVDEAGRDALRELVDEDNHATLAEYVERLAARTGQRISLALMCQLLQRLDRPRKKRPPGRPNGSAPRSSPSGPLMRSRSGSSPRTGWCSSTRPASRPR